MTIWPSFRRTTSCRGAGITVENCLFYNIDNHYYGYDSGTPALSDAISLYHDQALHLVEGADGGRSGMVEDRASTAVTAT